MRHVTWLGLAMGRRWAGMPPWQGTYRREARGGWGHRRGLRAAAGARFSTGAVPFRRQYTPAGTTRKRRGGCRCTGYLGASMPLQRARGGERERPMLNADGARAGEAAIPMLSGGPRPRIRILVQLPSGESGDLRRQRHFGLRRRALVFVVSSRLPDRHMFAFVSRLLVSLRYG